MELNIWSMLLQRYEVRKLCLLYNCTVCDRSSFYRLLEAKRAKYPLPHNLRGELASLFHSDGSDNRVESMCEHDIDTG